MVAEPRGVCSKAVYVYICIRAGTLVPGSARRETQVWQETGPPPPPPTGTQLRTRRVARVDARSDVVTTVQCECVGGRGRTRTTHSPLCRVGVDRLQIQWTTANRTILQNLADPVEFGTPQRTGRSGRRFRLQKRAGDQSIDQK